MARLPQKEDLAVLVVDDDKQDAFFIRSALKAAGIKDVEVVTNGPDAVAIIQEHRHDLTILDLNLPGMNGHDVLQAVKVGEGRTSMPIIVLSASSQKADVDKSYQLNANAYLVKPYGIEEYDQMAEGVKQFWADLVLTPRQAAAT